mmetsp:Transcript_3606/g.8873  ORF Transcript_3606/g.8873 Transcript_3606/m.8873 type:complete len:255 (-) Transcript_3606:281-1045(-)
MKRVKHVVSSKHLLGQRLVLLRKLFLDGRKLHEFLLDRGVVGIRLLRSPQVSLRLVHVVVEQIRASSSKNRFHVVGVDFKRLVALLDALVAVLLLQVAHGNVEVTRNRRLLNVIFARESSLVDVPQRLVILEDSSRKFTSLESFISQVFDGLGSFVIIAVWWRIRREVRKCVFGIGKRIVETIVSILSDFTAVANLDFLDRSISFCLHGLHPPNDIHPLQHLAKNHMLAVKVRSLDRCNEELTSVSSRSCVGHG